MKNIFIIDVDTKERVGMIDFLPRREERIIINYHGRNLEYKVGCVVYHPSENGILVFVNLVDNYYEKIIKNIKW